LKLQTKSHQVKIIGRPLFETNALRLIQANPYNKQYFGGKSGAVTKECRSIGDMIAMRYYTQIRYHDNDNKHKINRRTEE